MSGPDVTPGRRRPKSLARLRSSVDIAQSNPVSNERHSTKLPIVLAEVIIAASLGLAACAPVSASPTAESTGPTNTAEVLPSPTTERLINK